MLPLLLQPHPAAPCSGVGASSCLVLPRADLAVQRQVVPTTVLDPRRPVAMGWSPRLKTSTPCPTLTATRTSSLGITCEAAASLPVALAAAVRLHRQQLAMITAGISSSL